VGCPILRFIIHAFWQMPSGCRIRFWRRTTDGSCGGCHPIAAGLNWHSCPAAMIEKRCCGIWAGSWRTFISAHVRPCRRCGGIWRCGNRTGWARRLRSWPGRRLKTGKIGGKTARFLQLKAQSFAIPIRNRRVGLGIAISPTACRVMAKRLRDVCGMPESECSGVLDAA